MMADLLEQNPVLSRKLFEKIALSTKAMGKSDLAVALDDQKVIVDHINKFVDVVYQTQSRDERLAAIKALGAIGRDPDGSVTYALLWAAYDTRAFGNSDEIRKAAHDALLKIEPRRTVIGYVRRVVDGKGYLTPGKEDSFITLQKYALKMLGELAVAAPSRTKLGKSPEDLFAKVIKNSPELWNKPFTVEILGKAYDKAAKEGLVEPRAKSDTTLRSDLYGEGLKNSPSLADRGLVVELPEKVGNQTQYVLTDKGEGLIKLVENEIVANMLRENLPLMAGSAIFLPPAAAAAPAEIASSEIAKLEGPMLKKEIPARLLAALGAVGNVGYKKIHQAIQEERFQYALALVEKALDKFQMLQGKELNQQQKDWVKLMMTLEKRLDEVILYQQESLVNGTNEKLLVKVGRRSSLFVSSNPGHTKSGSETAAGLTSVDTGSLGEPARDYTVPATATIGSILQEIMKLVPSNYLSFMDYGKFAQVLKEAGCKADVVNEDGKAGFIFSTIAAFGEEKDGKYEEGIGPYLPELAKKGIRIAVVTKNDRQEGFIKELNRDIPDAANHIKFGRSIEEVKSNLHAPHYYYLKVQHEDIVSGVAENINIVVRYIIDAIGKMVGITEKMEKERENMHEAARQFAIAA